MRHILIRPSDIRRVLTLLLAGLLFGCGGGGGDADDTTAIDAFDANVCSHIGLKSTAPKPTFDPKIISGIECTPQLRSPVVPIVIRTVDGRVGLCSGSIVGSRSILTAGHCFHATPAPITSIEVTVAGRAHIATGFTVHPLYREDSDLVAIFADVAVLALADSLDIAPLPLLVSRPPKIGDVIDIFGFGINEDDVVGILRGGQMAVSSVSQTHIFARFESTGSNVCLGDSGGPATFAVNARSAVVGITSTGTAEAECRQGDVSLFTNVQDPGVRSFIESLVPDLELL